MGERIRLAVIGAGYLGRIHARLASQVEGVELVAVVDPLPEARRLAQAECQAPVLADYHELIGRIDAAVVATPTRFHHAVSLSLLEHGIHLLVEKPLATTVAEADEILAAAQQHGAIVQVGHIERFNPAWNQPAVWPMVREPKYIEASRTSGYTFPIDRHRRGAGFDDSRSRSGAALRQLAGKQRAGVGHFGDGRK